MPTVTVFHNISRDAGFGLNHIFDSAGRFYERASHELVRVFEFDAEELTDATSLGNVFLCEQAFHAFNVGTDPDFEQPGTKAHAVAVKYRARKLRSLSVGDVLAIGDKHYACASYGWKEVAAEELRVLSTRAAEALARRRYDFLPTEELTVTVPLEEAGTRTHAREESI